MPKSKSKDRVSKSKKTMKNKKQKQVDKKKKNVYNLVNPCVTGKHNFKQYKTNGTLSEVAEHFYMSLSKKLNFKQIPFFYLTFKDKNSKYYNFLVRENSSDDKLSSFGYNIEQVNDLISEDTYKHFESRQKKFMENYNAKYGGKIELDSDSSSSSKNSSDSKSDSDSDSDSDLRIKPLISLEPVDIFWYSPMLYKSLVTYSYVPVISLPSTVYMIYDIL